jgi:phospholipid/cholesterol/gamma-HCH transport system substrate-binding protein
MILSTPAKVGILTLVAFIALASIIIWKTEIFMVRKGYELTGSFQSIEGLTIGSEVRYRGFKVGKVLRIDPGPHDIKVYSVIDRDIKFPQDSHLRVAYDGIVGLKFLEIRPGTSEATYKPTQVIPGIRTAAIVDFVDIGSQNLQETKRIMENIRMMIEDPVMQEAIRRTVFTADKTAMEIEKLTMELRETNQGIRDVVADPKFQQNVKGTIRETEKTLSSANEFFDAVGNINLRASAGLDVGSRANAVRGNVDVVQKQGNYFRVGIGEGPTRTVSLLDVLFAAKASQEFGYRLGVINNQIGGGIAFYPSQKVTFRGDIYDINNPRPNWPKLRLGYEYEMREYMDMMLKADDLLNEGNRNVSVGIQIKPPGERIY